MPRPVPIVAADTAPIFVDESSDDARHWVRATELLRRTRARRVEREVAQAQTQEKSPAGGAGLSTTRDGRIGVKHGIVAQNGTPGQSFAPIVATQEQRSCSETTAG